MVAKTPELAAQLWDTWKQLSPKVGLKENEEKNKSWLGKLPLSPD